MHKRAMRFVHLMLSAEVATAFGHAAEAADETLVEFILRATLWRAQNAASARFDDAAVNELARAESVLVEMRQL